MTSFVPETLEMVDLVFEFGGKQIPADHRCLVWDALRNALPWLDEVPEIGIHPIRGPRTSYGMTLLPRRAKLVLRIPHSHVDAARCAEGLQFDVGGHQVSISHSRVRELAEVTTLYAEFVVTGAADEAAFNVDIASQLSRIGADCRFICGRRRLERVQGREYVGFPVALHDVPRNRSRLLQDVGLGDKRGLGFGILVPHKAISGLD